MRRAYERVLECWFAGKACTYKSPRGTTPIYTDGTTIFSYNDAHPIVARGKDGMIYVLAPHMDDKSGYVSTTTREQIYSVVPVAARAHGSKYPENVVCVRSWEGMRKVDNDGCLPKKQFFSCPGWWGPNPKWRPCRVTQEPLLGGRRRRSR